MENDTLIFYRTWMDAIDDLDNETAGELIKAMLHYSMDDEEPDELSPMAKLAFKMAKGNIDSCNKKRDGGKKGGRPSKEKTIGYENEKPMVSDKKTIGYENEKAIKNKDIDIEKDIEVEKEKDIDVKREKEGERKHKHGEYAHVLLTDDELSKLEEEYGKAATASAIQILDEYIEMKGAKYKSHYLAMRKWVFNAVKEHQSKNDRAAPGGDYWDELLKGVS